MSRIIEANKKLISHNIRLLNDFFDKYRQDFIFRRNSAGTTTFVKIREDGPLVVALKRLSSSSSSDGLSGVASMFCAELLARKNVLLLPAAEYDGFHDVYFRLGFSRANLAEGLREWDDFMQELESQK